MALSYGKTGFGFAVRTLAKKAYQGPLRLTLALSPVAYALSRLVPFL